MVELFVFAVCIRKFTNLWGISSVTTHDIRDIEPADRLLCDVSYIVHDCYLQDLLSNLFNSQSGKLGIQSYQILILSNYNQELLNARVFRVWEKINFNLAIELVETTLQERLLRDLKFCWRSCRTIKIILLEP